MRNKQILECNSTGITNLLLELAEVVTLKELTEQEERGAIKFITHLMDKWGENTYGDN